MRYFSRKLVGAALGGVLFLSSLSTIQAALVHRYKFDANANDSVGTAHGTLAGNAVIAGGKLVLSGAGYVTLPNGLLGNVTNATFETWVYWLGGENWQPIFDFGLSPGAINQGGPIGANSLILSPSAEHTETDPATGNSIQVPDPMIFCRRHGSPILGNTWNTYVQHTQVLPIAREVHVVVTYDFANQRCVLYLDGKLAASGPAKATLITGGIFNSVPYPSEPLPPLAGQGDLHNYLGRGNIHWNGELVEGELGINAGSYYTGEINDFRIYDHVLTAAEVESSFNLGSDLIPSDITSVDSLDLEAPAEMFAGKSVRPTVKVQLNGKTVDLSGDSRILFTAADSTLISQVPGRGVITPIKAGVTKLTATFSGKQDTVDIIIVPASLRHRYSFNDPAAAIIEDLVGNADATLQGGNINATGEVVLDGIDDYVLLPSGLLTQVPETTFELWVTWVADNTDDEKLFGEQQIFDFGASVPDQEPADYITLTPSRSVSWGDKNSPTNSLAFVVGKNSTRVWNDSRPLEANYSTTTASPLTLGQPTHIAVTYDHTLNKTVMYVNGAVVAASTALVPLSSVIEDSAVLGKPNSQLDYFFNGRINEFRIYEGPMTATDVLTSKNAGPDDQGVLRSITLETQPRMQKNSEQTAKVLAKYTKKGGADVTSATGTTITSSNSQVIQVASGGLLKAISPGNAVITATHQGKTASSTITVFEILPATLKHRYSFNDAPGSPVVRDSVSNANGSILGAGASLDGSQLTLNGTDAYVDLPNGIISKYSSISFEMWITWNGDAGSGISQEVFDFGNNSNGENQQGIPTKYASFSPFSTGGQMKAAISQNGPNALTGVLDGYFTPVGEEIHVAITYEPELNKSVLYVDGEQVDFNTAPLPFTVLDDVNNWLGRSNSQEPNYYGKFNEFRIYQGALDAQTVRDHFGVGPNALGSGGALSIQTIQNLPGKIRLVVTTDNPAVTHQVESAASINNKPISWGPVSGVSTVSSGAGQVVLEFPAPSGLRFYRVSR